MYLLHLASNRYLPFLRSRRLLVLITGQVNWMRTPRYTASAFPTEFDAFSHVPILSLVFNDDIVAHTPHAHTAEKTPETLPQIDCA